jgi:uncharacterized repeat protein (TIGR03803 family)
MFASLALVFVLVEPGSAQTVTSILSFDETNGQLPDRTTPVQGRDGRLYGTTYYGGTSGAGTVWAEDPSGSGGTVLYNFDGITAGNPQTGLTLATDGNFYGIAATSTYQRILFRLTAAGVLTVLHQFGETDGCYPVSPPIEASDGNLYGTTQGCGRSTVYQYTRAGVFTTIHFFDTNTEGKSSMASPMQASDGDLWGTNAWGGTGQCGAVFKMDLSGNVLRSLLMDCTHNRHPSSQLMEAANGDIYGTTTAGGTARSGSVFKLDATRTISTVYEFLGRPDLANPSNIIQATDGNLYGTSFTGGTTGQGGIYTIDSLGYSVLYDFGNNPRIVEDNSGIMQHTNGKFYSASESGGKYDRGVVFSVDLGLAPFVAFVRPSGAVAKTAQILGQGLTGTTGVTFNGVAATSFSVVSDTYMTVVIPAGATTGPVVVTTPTGTLAGNVNFRISN